MRFRSVAMLPALAWLAACATVENYQMILQSWVGASETELITAWGMPDEIYMLADGAEVVEYVQVEEYTTGGYTTYDTVTVEHAGGAKDSRGSDTYSETTTIRVPVEVPLRTGYRVCTVRFTMSAARIVTGWGHEGSNCKATAKQAAAVARTGLASPIVGNAPTPTVPAAADARTIDDRFFDWCRQRPGATESGCLCLTGALRHEGFTNTDMRTFLDSVESDAGSSRIPGGATWNRALSRCG